MAAVVTTSTVTQPFAPHSTYHGHAIELAPGAASQPPSSSEDPANPSQHRSFAEHPEHPAPLPPADSNQTTTALRVASVGFAFFTAGFNDGGIGVLIPYIIDDYHITTNVVSSVYGAGFFGWLLVALVQTHLAQYCDMGLLFILGALLQTVCQALRAWTPPFGLFAVSFFLASAGQALQDTQGNTYVAGVRSSHRWLGFIHGMYAGGCLVGPFVATVVASANTPSKWAYFYLAPLGLGVLNMVLVLTTFWERVRLVPRRRRRRTTTTTTSGGSPAPEEEESQNTPQDDGSGGSGGGIAASASNSDKASNLIHTTLRTPSVWMLSLFYFFYLGAVLTASGWVVEYLVVVRHGDLSKMGYVPAGFQGGTLLGRLLLVEPIHRLGERRMVFLFCLLAIGLQLLFWLVPNIIAASVAISLFGLFTGPFFPVGMSLATKLFSTKIRSTAMGFLFVISQLGGALFPIVAGVAAGSAGVSVLQPILVSLISATAVTWLLVPKPKMAGNDSLHQE